MCALAVIGVRHWLWADGVLLTPTERVLALSPTGVTLGEIVLGELIFWDIPTGLAVQRLRDPLMLAHHFGMAYVAFASLGASSGPPFCGYYAVFFFGFIEISGVFLTVVDIFHPKNKEWAAYEKSAAAPKWLQSLNGTMRIGFALAYLSIRAIYFPLVAVGSALPDMIAVAKLSETARHGTSVTALNGVAVFAVLFSVLQMYWGWLVLQQVLKILGITENKKDKTK
jgi:hypothetical protein